MASYIAQAGVTLLTGASDPEGSPITVRRINGVVVAAWPHVVPLTIGSATITQAGLVGYDDAGNILPHPGNGATKTAGTFTFTLWDGQGESVVRTATLRLNGSSNGAPVGSASTLTFDVEAG